MKKSLITLSIMLAAVALVGLISTPAIAITGQCSNCHTMHNSQDGAYEVSTYSDGTLSPNQSTPLGFLLKADCIACHTGDTGAGAQNSYGAPVILHINDPSGQGASNTLAGGDFYWVAVGLGGDDSTGHNVDLLSNEDVAIGKTPPGWDAAATLSGNYGQVAGGDGTWTELLTCAGKYGCHGDHSKISNDDGIRGAHHSNTGLTETQATAPTTVGGSYRFLGGIKGLENSQWNWAETASDHNEYYGVDGNVNYTDKSTINYSCAECHGDFHKTIGSASPWLRHPTDIVLPSDPTKEYQFYNPDNANQYSVEAPVARPTVPATSSSTVTPGDSTTDNGAIVSCLSCHRAHGSNEPDLLRWTYANMQAGTGEADTGCFVCHTTKNND